MNPEYALLRHTLATIAYRARKAVKDVPEEFGQFRAGEGSRAAGEILAHMGDLLDWGLALVKGEHVWRDAAPQAWEAEVTRFFAALEALDKYLSTPGAMRCREEALFQGPLADVLTHIGQIALLRRLAGYPMRAENYFRAEIVAGRVGPEQAPPVREF